MHGSCSPPVTQEPTGDKPANESRTQQQYYSAHRTSGGKEINGPAPSVTSPTALPRASAFQRSIHGYLSTRDMDPLVQFPNKHNGILM